MADARGLGPRGETLAGSSPVSPTMIFQGNCEFACRADIIGGIANKILKHEGSFWEREYWDTYMRDAD